MRHTTVGWILCIPDHLAAAISIIFATSSMINHVCRVNFMYMVYDLLLLNRSFNVRISGILAMKMTSVLCILYHLGETMGVISAKQGPQSKFYTQ